MTMHILHAVHAYKPAYRVGGPVVSVSATAETLVRKGHRVTVITSNSNLDQDLEVPLEQPIDVNGVSVWYFRRDEPLRKWLPFVPYLSRSMGFLYCAGMRPALNKLIRDVDVVHTHMPFVYPTYAAAHAAFRHAKPLIYHQRGNFDPARLKFRGRKKRLYIALVERPIMRRASTLIALTAAEESSFKALGVPTPCEIIPNGMDVRAVRPGAEERVRLRWNVPLDAKLVLFLGRLHPIKGAERLMEAFMLVGQRFPNTILMMAGPDEWRLEPQWRERLRGVLADRVIFPGMLTGDEKEDVLARADLFSLPSAGEGFSMAALEALAHGTAVMLSPGCHFPEVEQAGAGLVVPAEPRAMAAALAHLLADPGRLATMGAFGRQLLANRYTWDAITDRLIDIYAAASVPKLRDSHRPRAPVVTPSAGEAQ